MSSVRRSLLLFAVPLLIALGIMVWWRSRPAAAPVPVVAADAAVLVHTAQVARRDMPIRLRGLGSVQPWATVTLRARMDGRLDAVFFREGDFVEAGQLLAQLDDRVPVAELAQARAQLARDQAQLDNARADLKRYGELARHSAIDRQTVDTQRAQVAALEATVRADEAQVQLASVQLDYTAIRAPLTGRTGALLVDPGNVVRASDDRGLVVINQVDPIAVRFTVPDRSFAAVQRAARGTAPIPVEVFEQGRTDVLARGELVWVDNEISLTSGTLRLKARFDNPDHVLWPGQTVEVRLILGDRPEAIVVPEEAVQRSAEGLYVYVVGEDDRVQPRPVSMLLSQDGLSVITDGLESGERVVVDGQYRLRPGVRVAEAPVEEATADEAPPAEGGA